MSNDLTWVIDFRIFKEKRDYKQILSKDWCKIHHITELISDDFNEEKVIEYFNNYSYRVHLRDFWNDTVVISPKRLYIVFLADDEKIFDASLFAYYLKSNTLVFFNQIGLGPSSALNCNLCSYWDNSWSKEEEMNKINNIYSLNLFQNIPDINKRPFDYVLIFKDINSGLSQYEYRNRNSKSEYFDTKIISLIYHLSNVNQNLIRNTLNANKWCVSFGASHIYFNAQVLYAKSAKEIADLLVKELIFNEKEPWEIQFNEPLENKLKQLEFNEVFKSIKYQRSDKNAVSTNTSFYIPDISPVWDWFGLNKLKIFFSQSLSQILFNIKKGKVEYLFNGYNEIRSELERNFHKLIDFKESNIKSPEIVFDEYFKFKPFSFQSYRKGLLLLIDEIEKRKNQNKTEYNKRYPDPDSPYSPCTMNPEVGVEYKQIVDENNGKDDVLLAELTKNQLLKLKEKVETLAHPLSLFLKTIFLSTIFILLAYLPLTKLFYENNWAIYGSLSALFIFPFLLMWNTFKKNTNALIALCNQFEALSKYYVTRKTNNYISRIIDAVYDEYLNNCKYELKRVEDKIKEAELFLKSTIGNDDSLLDIFSVRSATSLAESIPPIKISINGVDFETKDLKNNTDKLFPYFRQTIGIDNTNLNSLVSNNFEYFNMLIIHQLANSPDNISSSADLLFPKGAINFKNDDKVLILNLLPPFNSGDSSRDKISREILIDSYKSEDDTKIFELFDNGLKPKIIRYKTENSKLVSSGSISILNINQPNSNIFDLFSSSLGGNKISFIKHTENFYSTKKEVLMNIIKKVIKETIISTETESTDKREEIFQSCLKGFDLNFDEDGWQIVLSNLDDINSPFIKEFRGLFKNEFETLLSEYLISKEN